MNLHKLTYKELTEFYLKLKSELKQVDAKIKEIDASVPILNRFSSRGNYSIRFDFDTTKEIKGNFNEE